MQVWRPKRRSKKRMKKWRPIQRYMTELPDELLLDICQKLDTQALKNLTETSSRIYNVCSEILRDKQIKGLVGTWILGDIYVPGPRPFTEIPESEEELLPDLESEEDIEIRGISDLESVESMESEEDFPFEEDIEIMGISDMELEEEERTLEEIQGEIEYLKEAARPFRFEGPQIETVIYKGQKIKLKPKAYVQIEELIMNYKITMNKVKGSENIPDILPNMKEQGPSVKTLPGVSVIKSRFIPKVDEVELLSLYKRLISEGYYKQHKQ